MNPLAVGRPVAHTLALPLAKTGEAAKAGPIGLAVIILLCITCYFLFKSMSKHLRNVRDNFPEGGVPVPPDDRARARERLPAAQPVPRRDDAASSGPTLGPTHGPTRSGDGDDTGTGSGRAAS